MDQKDKLLKSRYSDKTFQENYKEAKIDQININYDNYIIEGTENTLMVLQKKNDTFTVEKSSSSDKFAKSFMKVKVDTNNINDLFSKTTTNLPTQEEQNQKRKSVFQNLFLLHKYQEITQATALQNIPQEVKTYKDRAHLALAKFARFNLLDPDNKEIPCFLTERPINGPLPIYLEYISKFNTSTNSESDFDSSGKDINGFSVINEHFVTTPVNLTKENKFLLIVGIAAGIEFIHRLNKVHGQLNPNNIYLDENFLPKICGYGFIEPYNIDDNSNDDVIDDDDDDDEHDFGPLTNIAFIAPEVLNGKHIYQKSDVFSIGMIIYYILSGIEPFKTDRAQVQMKNIFEGDAPDFPECISDDWKKIILRCCELNPKTRYSSAELLSVLLKEETRDKLISSIPDSDQETDQASQSNANLINIRRIKDSYINSIINDFQFDEDFHDCHILREMVPDPTAIDAEAKEYILKASKDDPESLLIVGRYFLNGEHHLPKDEGNAFALIRKAAALNNPESIKTLAGMFRKGIGSTKNLQKALKLYKDALKYYKDDKIEKNFIDKQIQEIENELENPTPETEEPTKHESIIITSLIPRTEDKTAIELRRRDLKKQKDCDIIICGLPSAATKADVESTLRNYKDIAVSIKTQGLYDSANVSFNSKEDKDKFVKYYRKNKNRITIRKKNITEIIGIPKTAKDIEKERKTKRRPPIKKSPSKNKTHRKSDQDNKELPYLINFDDYYPGPENEDYVLIGKGNFGIAYKAYRKEDNKLFVAKIFKNSFNGPSQRKNFVRETAALIEINSPLIIKLIGYSMYSLINPSQKVATMIMEYAQGGTLEDVLNQEHKKRCPSWWNNTTKLKTIIGIVKAMAFVHELNYIHRDLKPENIFFDENHEIKIGDFGCARKFDNNNEVIMTFYIGTPVYTAPEIFDEDNLRYKWEVDVYSFGIILYQILTKKIATAIYPGIKTYYNLCEKVIKNKRKPAIPKGLNPSLVDLMQRCWSHSIDDRPSFAFIFEVFKRTFENESPEETFFPDVDVEEIRKYINKLVSLDAESKSDSDSD